MNLLADKLRHARQNVNLSQKELGRKLGISEMAISAYETGRAIPPLPALKRISKITNVPLIFFLEDEKRQISLESLYEEMQKMKKDISKILNILSSYERT